jgi:hypothetical protein
VAKWTSCSLGTMRWVTAVLNSVRLVLQTLFWPCFKLGYSPTASSPGLYFISCLALSPEQMAEALCYKPEGRESDSWRGHYIFQFT